MPDTYLDGDFSRPTPVGAPRLSYPFLQNKDRVSAVLAQDFWQTLETFHPADLSTPHSVALPDFYLVAESAPERVLANLVAFTRTYARVPASQVTYSTIAINKPTAASAGGTTASTQILYTNLGAGTSLGTYTTFTGYVFGPNNKIYGPTKASTSANNGADTDITSASHGIAGTETLIVAGASGFAARYGIVAAGAYTVPDANTIKVTGYNLGTAATSLAVYLRDYTPGVDRVRTRLTDAFYLPGVTSGINSATDIPIPDVAMNDTLLLALLLANTSGFQTYDAQPLELWAGQIHRQRTIAIDMANL